MFVLSSIFAPNRLGKFASIKRNGDISDTGHHRWYIKHGRYKDAFESLCRLRRSKLQAARDLFYIHVLLDAEREVQQKRNRYIEIFTIPRNRRALQASFIVMILQQLCGVNVLAYVRITTLHHCIHAYMLMWEHSIRRIFCTDMASQLRPFDQHYLDQWALVSLTSFLRFRPFGQSTLSDAVTCS